MGKHYVTFGQDHIHVVDGKQFDKDTVAVIPSRNFTDGRVQAYELFGDKFCTSYQDEQWNEDRQLHYFPKGYLEI